MNTKVQTLSGHILEETPKLSLAELCRGCHIPAETMIELVDYGIISPCQGETTKQWRFHSTTLIRVDKAMRLKADLGVNLAGAALVLELLDEVNELRAALCQAKY